MNNLETSTLAPWRGMAKFFEALACGERQQILSLFEQGESMSVGEIVAATMLSRSVAYHHVKFMKDAGILTGQKIGRETHYWVDKAYLEKSLSGVLQYIRNEI